MRTTNRIRMIWLVLALLCALAPVAPASVALHWDQDWLRLPPQSDGALTIMITDTLALRAAEFWVKYDPTVVRGITTSPGALFEGGPCFLWEVYEEDTPGWWHASVVIMGGECLTTGPGELMTWEFQTLDRAVVTAVTATKAVLFAPDGSLIEDVSLGRTFVSVGDQPAASSPDRPQMAVSLAPNPFNPSVTLSIELSVAGPVTAGIFALDGRLVRRLDTPWLPVGSSVLKWDGTDAVGRPLPSGIYLIRCKGPQGAVTNLRGTLVR